MKILLVIVSYEIQTSIRRIAWCVLRDSYPWLTFHAIQARARKGARKAAACSSDGGFF